MESDIKQETPIQIRVRFERNEKGDIGAIFDDNGKWVLMEPSKLEATIPVIDDYFLVKKYSEKVRNLYAQKSPENSGL